MDPNIISGIIVAIGTILGAIIGALLARSDFLDKLFRGNKFTSLKSKWESTWVDLYDRTKTNHHENFIITRQKGS